MNHRAMKHAVQMIKQLVLLDVLLAAAWPATTYACPVIYTTKQQVESAAAIAEIELDVRKRKLTLRRWLLPPRDVRLRRNLPLDCWISEPGNPPKMPADPLAAVEKSLFLVERNRVWHSLRMMAHLKQRATALARQRWRRLGKGVREVTARVRKIGRVHFVLAYIATTLPVGLSPICGAHGMLGLEHWSAHPRHRAWKKRLERFLKHRRHRQRTRP